MFTTNEPTSTRVRVIYAMERINRLLDGPGRPGYELPEETLELVLSCINAISDVVERRTALDAAVASNEDGRPATYCDDDESWHVAPCAAA
jgi:hypothetical protein